MLELTKTRQLVAEFSVGQGTEKKLVKTTIINIDANAVSQVSETMHDADLYAAHRRELRTDEQKLRETRYAIEDEILAEQSKAEEAGAAG
ncbi:hypothetical protein MS1_58 [Streptococcus virus MS1]|jgi:putative uncharacterized protein orf4|nr:hypothetical protein MS1_58 [Streptococcus virus MS1]